MKKFLISFLLLISLSLMGCSNNDNFQKSKDCVDMTPQFEQKYAYQVTDAMGVTSERKITSVFYSYKLNTCVFIMTTFRDDGLYNGLMERARDGLKDSLIKYHWRSTSECDTQAKQEGCLSSQEFNEYIENIK